MFGRKRFYLEISKWARLCLCSQIIKMRQNALSASPLKDNSVFAFAHFFMLGQPQTVASLSAGLHCSLIFALLRHTVPDQMSNNPPGVTFKFSCNNSVLCFTSTSLPLTVLRGLFVFCFAVIVNKEFVPSLIALSC